MDTRDRVRRHGSEELVPLDRDDGGQVAVGRVERADDREELVLVAVLLIRPVGLETHGVQGAVRREVERLASRAPATGGRECR